MAVFKYGDQALSGLLEEDEKRSGRLAKPKHWKIVSPNNTTLVTGTNKQRVIKKCLKLVRSHLGATTMNKGTRVSWRHLVRIGYKCVLGVVDEK